MKLNSTADLTPRLPEIKVPTLILHGERDQIIPVAASKQMHELIPTSTMIVIPEAGHVPTITHSEQVLQAIHPSLDTLD